MKEFELSCSIIDVMPSTSSGPAAYFITMGSYGAWLHGDDRGSARRDRPDVEGGFLPPAPRLAGHERDAQVGETVEFDAPIREIVLGAVREVTAFRGWKLWACHVRTQHIHMVVTAIADPDKVMVDCKARATRLLREAGSIGEGQKVWARHGSTRHLWNDRDIEDACWYVLFEQGDPMAVFDGRNIPGL